MKCVCQHWHNDHAPEIAQSEPCIICDCLGFIPASKPPKKRATRLIRWTWTNWTFGLWYARMSRKSRAAGIDLGPLGIVWRWF